MLQNKARICLLFLVAVCFSCHKENAYRYTPKPQVIIDAKAAASNSIHLVKDTVYVLAVNLMRDSSQSIVIDAGTLVKVKDNLSITINPGARIEAEGNSSEPIIFTSFANLGTQGAGTNGGNWDGIRIMGNGSRTSQGILSYVRIEFAGIYSPSLLLTLTNQQTIFNNIQVSYSYNNASIELDGGNSNLSNFLSYSCSGTDIIIKNGYAGFMQNILAYRTPFFAARGNNLGGLFISDFATNPVISNLTVLGPDTKYGIDPDYSAGGNSRRAALITTGGSTFHIRNSLFYDFPLRTYLLDDFNTADSLDKSVSEIAYSVFYNADSGSVFYLKDGAYPPFNSTDMRNFLLSPRFNNNLFTDRQLFGLPDVYKYYDGIPDPQPAAGSPLLKGADFNDSLFADPFFEKVSYVGAIGGDNWMHGWTNYIPLQTDYNY